MKPLADLGQESRSWSNVRCTFRRWRTKQAIPCQILMTVLGTSSVKCQSVHSPIHPCLQCRPIRAIPASYIVDSQSSRVRETAAHKNPISIPGQSIHGSCYTSPRHLPIGAVPSKETEITAGINL